MGIDLWFVGNCVLFGLVHGNPQQPQDQAETSSSANCYFQPRAGTAIISGTFTSLKGVRLMRSATLLLSLLAFVPAGCVASVNPLASEDVIVFDEGLIGTWVSPAGPDKGKEAIISADGDGYKIEQMPLGSEEAISAKLVQLGEVRILDVTYAQRPKDPSHHFILLSRSDDTLTLRSIDALKLQALLKSKEPTLSTPKTTADYPFLHIAWSTEQLQDFFGRYGESVFSGIAETSLRRSE